MESRDFFSGFYSPLRHPISCSDAVLGRFHRSARHAERAVLVLTEDFDRLGAAANLALAVTAGPNER